MSQISRTSLNSFIHVRKTEKIFGT